LYPVRFDELCALVNRPFLTPEKLLKDHSVLPYYRPFAQKRIYDRLLAVVGAIDSGKLNPYSASFSREHQIRYCPHCIVEDQHATPKRHPYLRTLHQIAGYAICHRHQQWLRILPRNHKRLVPFYSFDALAGLETEVTESQKPITALVKNLAEDIASVPELFENIDSERLWNFAAERYFFKTRRKAPPIKFKKEVLASAASVPGLSLIRTDFVLNSNGTNFRPPVCAFVMLVIRCSGETPRAFVELLTSGKTPELLHPCRNPQCNHFGHIVIEKPRDPMPGTGYYQLTCPYCGLAYVVTTDQLRKNKVKVLRVCSLGERTPEFQRQWIDPNITVKSMTQKYGLTVWSLFYLAHFQKLPLKRPGRLDTANMRKFRNFIIGQQLKVKKAKKTLEETFSHKPKQLIYGSRMPAKIQRALAYLRQHDQQWISDFLTKAKRSSRAGRAHE